MHFYMLFESSGACRVEDELAAEELGGSRSSKGSKVRETQVGRLTRVVKH